MRVWLASYPRSGNTFFRLVLRDRYGITSTPARNESKFPADVADHLLVKTHALPDRDNRPALYVLRDGRDALVSYAHFVIGFHRGPDAGPVTPDLFRSTLRNLILEDRSEYGTWAANVEAWTARPKTYVVRYEDLLSDPRGVADRAVAAIGLKLSPVADEITPFEELRRGNPKFFRRGVTGTHQDEFPPDLLDLFWKHNGATMARVGYAGGSARKAA